MKRILEQLPHHQDDYECMWNGIEDIYVSKTKEQIPNQFFFAMSGFGGCAYIKTGKADVKRLVSFGEGRTRQMYRFLSPIVGFDYRFHESKTPELALAKAKKEIDAGFPVVLGALDMYYLKYYGKLYRKEHIPFHYVLMVGYDDAAAEIHLYDCGREERLTLTYADLLLAMGAEYAGLCKPNTICTVRMENPNSQRHIIKTALRQRSGAYVNPPTGFLGFAGMKKLAKELPGWEKELGRDETVKILRRTVDFLGSVPKAPNRLLGVKDKDDIAFMGSRDKMSEVYRELSERYKNARFEKASGLFRESGLQFGELCGVLIDYILGSSCSLENAGKIVLRIAELEYSANGMILEAIETI